jgi:hypothetical protein
MVEHVYSSILNSTVYVSEGDADISGVPYIFRYSSFDYNFFQEN